MLTIENTNKILHKTLGKKNFYVARVEQTFDANPLGVLHKYIFELSNGKYAITVILDRNPVMFEFNHYRLYATSGVPIYLLNGEISNMDIFIDKLRLVSLG